MDVEGKMIALGIYSDDAITNGKEPVFDSSTYFMNEITS
jgi:hypothetical protein